MKVFIRKISTGLLFEDPDEWTSDCDKARSFRHSAEAMDLVRLKHLSGVEVLLTFDEPKYSVRLPLV